MKKVLSISLIVAILATMMSAFTVFAAADTVTGPSLEEQVALDDAADIYRIYTAEDYVYFFNNRGEFSGSTMMLENDIDLNPEWTAQRVDTLGVYTVNQAKLVTKLSIPGQVCFSDAVFDGQGHTVRGVYVEGVGGSEGAGLIGRAKNTTIKNVRFENCATINAKSDKTLGSRAGGIVTVADDIVRFENVYADIVVTGKSNVGGFVALNGNDQVDVYYDNCVSACDVFGTGSYVGGFVGYNWDHSSSMFTNCGFYGKVEVPATASGDDPTPCGMFVGAASAGTTASTAKKNVNSRVALTNCIGAGTTVADREWNGALVGYTFFHPTNITAAASAGKTQYINVAMTNCIWVGDYAGAIGGNVDKGQVIANKATIGVDAQYNYIATAVEKVEANTRSRALTQSSRWTASSTLPTSG